MNARHLIVIIKSIVLTLVGTMLFSCENDLSVVRSLKVDDSTPISTSYDINMEYTDSGKVVMLMKSPLIERFTFDEEYLEMPNGVEMLFYDSIGNTKSTLQADYAIVYQKTNTMEAHNNVIATNAQGQQLYTEELIWDKEKKLIYTEKDVKVVTDGKVLFGDGLTADESFDNWEITNPHGGFDIDENPEEENK